MPISKNLSKIQKNMSGKDQAVHPRGRKFRQLNRATLRNDKLIKEKSTRLNNKEGEMVRLRYFQEAIEISKQDSYSVQDIQHMIRVFISRDDEALAKEKASRRKGRPKSSKQDQLETRIEQQQSEFKSGFLIPDLTDSEIVSRLRKWNGTSGGVTSLRFVRVSESSTDESILVEADGDITM